MDHTLKIEYRDVDTLVPYAKNARNHSQEQIAEIAGSIKAFGFNSPVGIDGAGGIVAGHGRVLAAKMICMKQVPCVVLDHLSERDKRAYIIADNRMNERSGWNKELLALELGDLSEMGLDLGTLGFDQGDLYALNLDLTPTDFGEATDDAEPPDEFGAYDEDIETEHQCPKCGYVWSGKPA